MKTASTALIALLASNTEAILADLVTITLIGGGVLRLTSSDVDLIVPSTADFDAVIRGQTFSSRGLQFLRSKIKTTVGVQVDKLDLTLYGDSTVLINSIPCLTAIQSGQLDGARITLYRAYITTAPIIIGTIVQFVGAVAQVDVGRTEARVSVTSDMQLLNIQMPKNVWQPSCINVLYGTACGLVRTPVSAAAIAGSTASSIAAGTIAGTAVFDLGYITFTSGLNVGLTRTVKTGASGTGQIITLLSFLPSVPVAGDTFNLFTGCDKTMARCTALGNLPRYRGMPFIPPPAVLT